MERASVLAQAPVRVGSWAGTTRLWPVLIVAVAYYVGCQAGFALRFPGSGISFFWPPTAILTAALMLTARGSWVSILGSAFLAHAVAHIENGVPSGAWPVQFIGNAAQALIAAFIVRRVGDDVALFTDARRALVFILGPCLLAPAVASLIPVYVYINLGWASDFAHAWRDRAVTNTVASITLLPSLVIGGRYLRSRPTTLPAGFAEYTVLLLGILAAHVLTGSLQRTDMLGLFAGLYAPVPLLLWATVRFGAASSFALLWSTVLAISSVSAGYGPLRWQAPADAVVGVQLMIAATAVPMMLLAALLEQSRAERRMLVDVEQQNGAILRALPDMVFLLTRDGEHLHGYSNSSDPNARSPAAMAGDIRHLLPPDALAMFTRAIESVTAERPSVIEYTRWVDGQPRRYEGRFVAVDSDRILTVVRDITERWQVDNDLRETQQRYALATAAGGVGVWEFDVVANRVRLEGALQAMLGYADGEIGDRVEDLLGLIHHADRAHVQARLMRLAGGLTGVFSAEFRMVRKDGSPWWMSATGAVTDRIGALPSRILGTYTDITERKEAERSLMEANDVIVRTGRIAVMAEFSASIAHEVKQPLTAIAANATACLQLAQSVTLPGDVIAALTDMVADSQRASRIVDSTRQMFTEHAADVRPLNLNDSIRNVLEIASARLWESHVTVQLELNPALPEVEADGVQIQQVLLNLVVNGVEAMQDTPETLRLLRLSSRFCRNVVVVSVRDSGSGFAAHPRRVFEPFYTTKREGVGMGLAICRSIIRNHGGALWAVTNGDRGATFRLRLYAVAKNAMGPAVRSPIRRVLIVDDDEGLRRALVRMVRSWGHQVAGVADASSALSAVKSFRPDFVLTDLSMRGVSGIELARQLRFASSGTRPRLVALTALRDEDIRDECLTSGFEAFLAKPIEGALLRALLAS